MICIEKMPKLAGTQSSPWRRERLPRRNPSKKSALGQSSIATLVLSSVIALPCEAESASRTASIRADWSASLPIARALSSGQDVSMIKVGISSSSDVVLRQHDAWHTPAPMADVQSATAQSAMPNKAAISAGSSCRLSHAVVAAGVGSEVVGSEVAGAMDGDGVGDDVGFGVVGSEVVGLDVVGSDVVGSAVVGSEVVGSNVVGSEVVGAEVVGSDVVGSEVEGADVVGAEVVGSEVAGVRVVGPEVVG